MFAWVSPLRAVEEHEFSSIKSTQTSVVTFADSLIVIPLGHFKN